MRIAHKIGVLLAAIALLLILLLVPRHGRGQSTQDIGDYVVRYSAISTEHLAPAMAAKYGISRGHDRGLLNIAVEQKASHSRMVRADVSATVSDLTGHQQVVVFTETEEGGQFDYLGQFTFSGSGSYLFTVNVTPPGATQPHVIKFNQDYVAD